MTDSTHSSYTLNALIRQNPDAEVTRGCRNADGAPVVVKALRSERPSPIELARLQQEFTILQSLDLPCVVRALALEPRGHGLALVLEDAGDVSVGSLIQAGRLDLERSLDFAIAMTRVVAAVHAQGIVHKDLKPEHFIVRPEEPDAMVLVDFGLATRLTRGTAALTPVSQLEGSLPYIAPEQTGRMNRVTDRRSDLYSLGVTLYRLFTGHLPFGTADPLELVHSHIARMPRPPHELDAAVPEVLSDIILKLLAKAAEDRYQSAQGLGADLERCRRGLRRDGTIPRFPLAELDASDQLSVPQKLYGRQDELRMLLGCFDRASQGAAELLMLSGHSGVGKTALASELHRTMATSGYFAVAKFDRLACGIPYAPIVHACRQLVQALLAERPEQLSQRKQELCLALGQNGKLIIDFVPDLELVMGPQPEVPVLGPTESQNRFELVLQQFLGGFASAGRPLVLFLDDLQWADPASLRLLGVALTGSTARHLLVIGGYRDNEVDSLHPLTLALQELRTRGVAIRELALEPLRPAHVTELLADTLHSSADQVAPLGELLFSNCRGNPFFLLQVLDTLHQEGLLRFSEQRRCWEWDLDPIRGVLVTDDVVEFMLARLDQLSPVAREALRFAACIGDGFDDRTLAVVSGRAPTELRPFLWEALTQGLIVPVDANLPEMANLAPDMQAVPDLAARYRFAHDRVRQAAYALISAEERAEVHLSIGRLLLARCANEPGDDELFTVVDHLDRGVQRITHPQEAERVARLNLSAGTKARAAAAPAVGVRYLDLALRLLGESAWTRHYELAYLAHLTKAECDYLTGNQEDAFRLLDAVENHARTVLERIAVRKLRIVLLTNAGRPREACLTAVDSLRMLGVELPSPDDTQGLRAQIGEEFGAYQGALARRNIESLAELPSMSDPEHLALMGTLVVAMAPAFQCNPELHVALVLKAVAEPLRHGTSPASPFFYIQYAIVHMVITGDLATAYRFGQLGMDMSGPVGDPALAGPVHFVFGCFVAHWRKHLSVALEHFRTGFRLSLELGDYVYAGFCASIGASYRFFAHGTLEEVEASIPDALAFAQRTQDVVDRQFCELFLSGVRALKGQTRQLASLDREAFEEAAFRHALLPAVVPWYQLVKTILLFLSGGYAEALAAADAFRSGPGMLATPEHAFYRALTLAQLIRVADPNRKQDLLDRLKADAASLAPWAESAPINYAARHKLVLAELAAIGGDTVDAMRYYDEGIARAQEGGFLQVEAIACELSGRFHLSQQRTRVARAYLTDALYAYQRWGASAKAEQLKSEYPRFLEPATPAQPADVRSTIDSIKTTTGRFGGRLDLNTVIRATEALATELSFDNVLERLMRELILNAGAQRGFLVLGREGVLTVEAAVTIDPHTVRLDLGEDLETTQELSRAIVQYVARTMQPLVLGDAGRSALFATDPYVLRSGSKSILAVPMLHRGKVIGVLYLENSTTTDAFHPARAELLQFLAAQAAAALENARLYGELHAASEQLRLANERLESQVATRTDELRRALADLWSEMDLARKVQTVLLPMEPRLPGYEIAATMVPADKVGGDYYDVIPTGAGRDWVLIGDVSGHGVSAGLVTMMVQSAIRTAVLKGSATGEALSPAGVLSHLNFSLWSNLRQIGGDQYMTITALELAGARVRYAGLHQDILVYRAASDTVERIETTGTWIGVIEDLSPVLEDGTLELAHGDTLLLYTDGLTESMMGSGTRLGTDGLVARFRSVVARTRDPAAIVRGILGPLSGKAVEDDVTAMVIRYMPAEATA
jgi:predicted ATPase/serine phosphatase RsbU (regulator of sigma subunit)/tRNA A-37 threonylcarbamoyl transferase component Bud32